MIEEALKELIEEVKDKWSDEELELVQQVAADYAQLMGAAIVGQEIDDHQLETVKATLGNLSSAAQAAALSMLNSALGKALDILADRFRFSIP